MSEERRLRAPSKNGDFLWQLSWCPFIGTLIPCAVIVVRRRQVWTAAVHTFAARLLSMPSGGRVASLLVRPLIRTATPLAMQNAAGTSQTAGARLGAARNAAYNLHEASQYQLRTSEPKKLSSTVLKKRFFSSA